MHYLWLVTPHPESTMTRPLRLLALLLLVPLLSVTACRSTGWIGKRGERTAQTQDAPERTDAAAQRDEGADGQRDELHVNTVTEIKHLSQGWTEAERQRFHYWSQGSQIMPYSYFVALREAGTEKRFARDEMFMRHRYLPEKPHSRNPDGLAIGFAKDGEHDAIGMTCAACHTTQVNHDGVGYRIDGGGTHADFEGFLTDLLAALEATWADESVFRTFAADVLGEHDTEEEAARLRDDYLVALEGVRAYVAATATATKGGYSRVDALGGAYNVVLVNGLGIPENRADLAAPVSYPPLWDSGYYDYVEWNGLNHNAGYGPLGRNVGEALGVFSHVDMASGANGIYKTSVRVGALVHIEELSRKLDSPLWPDAFPPIDDALAERGRALYDEHCFRCHARMPRGDRTRAPRAVMVPLAEIRTDPTMAVDFAERTARTGPLEGRKIGLGLGEFGATASGVDLLTRFVIGTILAHPEAAIEEQLLAFAEHRGTFADEPGRLGADTLKAYRARALNGIWSSAPYLHNGSVPTIYQLLLPPDERPTTFTTGRYEIDTRQVGMVTEPFEGGFLFDTSLTGNHNGGHLYGTDLPDEDRWALVEYLKSL